MSHLFLRPHRGMRLCGPLMCRMKVPDHKAVAQVFGMPANAIPPDGQGLTMEPEKPGSDISKRINAVVRCVTHRRSLQFGLRLVLCVH